MSDAARGTTHLPIWLPHPQTRGGLPLLSALGQRRSVSAFADIPISEGMLSNLLWAAFGIHRSMTGDRTAPYWKHGMVIDIYVARADGIWCYEPNKHVLSPCSDLDIRAETGTEDFAAGGSIELIYVAHGERMDVQPDDRRLYASVDTAFIGENVYLFCASEGLGTVFHGPFDRAKLAKLLDLRDQQFVTFVQTVGYPRIA